MVAASYYRTCSLTLSLLCRRFNGIFRTSITSFGVTITTILLSPSATTSKDRSRDFMLVKYNVKRSKSKYLDVIIALDKNKGINFYVGTCIRKCHDMDFNGLLITYLLVGVARDAYEVNYEISKRNYVPRERAINVYIHR